MSICISVAPTREFTWCIQRSVFDAFVDILVDEYASDLRLVSEIKIATYAGGVSLDLLFEKDRDLAVRMRDALHSIALGIAEGKYGSERSQGGGFQEESQKLFGQLASMMEKCELRTRSENEMHLKIKPPAST